MALKGYRQEPEHVRKRIDARLATLRDKPRPVSREWLVREYVERKRACSDIAAELGRDPKTIWAWLKFYGIPTRARGAESSPASFVKGQPSAFAGRSHSHETRAKLSAIATADGRVPFDPTVGSYMKGRSGPDTPSWRGGITPERQAFYASAEWKAAVVAVWHRAEAHCERCDLPYRDVRATQKFHVHHIVSFAVRGLRATVANLALLCPECHRFVHSRANVDQEFLGGTPCPS